MERTMQGYYILNSPNAPIKLWVPPHEVESSALDQLRDVAALPWVVGVAVMPDVHAGEGATIGSVIAMDDAICPNAVGVDIGCGMCAVRLTDGAATVRDLPGLRQAIEATVPTGFNLHSTDKLARGYADPLFDRTRHFPRELQGSIERARHQLGTLGGGNHFIEVSHDEVGRLWLVLHSGSRNIGLKIAEHYAAVATTEPRNDGHPRALASLFTGTSAFVGYFRDLDWAVEYAALNRLVMRELLLPVLQRECGFALAARPSIECVHNYATFEAVAGIDDKACVVTRKGAISARSGQFGVIPGAMGRASFIVEGLGNPDAMNSAAHGAGRKMSRGAAKRAVTSGEVPSVAAQTAGLECRKTGIEDELPSAYKDVETVMEYQKTLVRPLHRLTALLTVKG